MNKNDDLVKLAVAAILGGCIAKAIIANNKKKEENA